MAEALFRRMAEARGVPVEVKSAGVAATAGQPMAKHAAEVLRERGIASDGFRSGEVNHALADWADVILTMTAQHKRQLLELYPQFVEKTFALKEFAGADPGAAALHRERESLVADLQLRMALQQPIREEERNRLYELDRQLPDMDIPDPFGGSLRLYETTASDMELAIAAILDKWKG
jgi:protein-tyrosine-phosphatase